MKVTSTKIPDLMVIEPKVFGDNRGFFLESYNERDFHEALGRKVNFVQDNHSRSAKGVLRGLHYQLQQPQGKLVRVVKGAVFDVAVDVRKSSPTFGKWVGLELSEQNQKQFWIPEGFAHGFQVLTETADFLYKATDFYAPEYERALAWNDVKLAIQWKQLGEKPTLSARDSIAPSLDEAELFK